ncbi:MAG: glycosyltransferase [Synergistaceae bacterium]|jgi:glycosyltransferase involved in cell wall biosynthesis|nr:glycosyltransferase [Synergistaceae bacterium]
MKLAIDLQSLQGINRYHGIGRYAFELTKAMIAAAPDDEFILLLNNYRPEIIQKIRYSFRAWVPQTNIKVFEAPSNLSYVDLDNGKVEAVEDLIGRFIAGINPDVLLIPSVSEEFPCQFCMSAESVGRKIPVGAILYDLIPLTAPDMYLTSSRLERVYYKRLETLCNADLLLSISKFSADEGVRLLGDFLGEIVNIRGGIAPIFTPAAEKTEASYINLQKPFILCAPSFEARKNQEGLIRAFACLPPSLRSQYQLVLAGHISRRGKSKLMKIVLNSRLSSEDVIFTGRVNDEELLSFYRTCKLFVFPSFWEGLGLPALEAMACGAPVIASDTTSLRELLPLPEAGFDPYSISSIARTMQKFLSDEKKLAQLRKAGAEVARQFTWEQTARTALEALRALCEKQKNAAFSELTPWETIYHFPKSYKRELGFCQASNEIELGKEQTVASRKIAWVSPWDKCCAIAAYSKNLIENMRATPTIFCQRDGYSTSLPGPEAVPCWKKGKSDNLMELTLTIDQGDFDEVMVQFDRKLFDFSALAAFIEHMLNNKKSVFVMLHSSIEPCGKNDRGIFNFRFRKFKAVLRKVTAIFVHNEADLLHLDGLGIKSSVRYIPRGIPSSSFTSRQAPEQHASKKISTYGFFRPGKGLEEIIDAFTLLTQDIPDLEMIMVNARCDGGEGISNQLMKNCLDKIEKLGLREKVKIIADYLENDASLRHIRETDLLVLPYQPDSQSTGSAVRTGLSSGIPAAVTPLPIFSDLLGAVFTLPGFSAPEIAEGIKDILRTISENGSKARQTQKEAAMFRKTHDFSIVASYLEHRMSALSLGARQG